jgi:hypothetical protein
MTEPDESREFARHQEYQREQEEFAEQSYIQQMETQIEELEARLEQTKQWRNYYRAKWLGRSTDDMRCPMTDAELEAWLITGRRND